MIAAIYREKPHDTEWLELIKIKIPLLLNYVQCKLIKKDYYAVIEHCTEVRKPKGKSKREGRSLNLEEEMKTKRRREGRPLRPDIKTSKQKSYQDIRGQN